MRIATDEPSLTALFQKGQVGLIRLEFQRLHDIIADLQKNKWEWANAESIQRADKAEQELANLQDELRRLKETRPTSITEVDIKANPAWAIAVFRVHRQRDRAEIKRLKRNLEHKVYMPEGIGGGVLRKPRFEDGWLPISTAPHDGTEILCFCVEPEFYGEEDPFTCLKVCFWGMQTEDYSCWMSNYGYEQRPTHWMSLPKPPIT